MFRSDGVSANSGPILLALGILMLIASGHAGEPERPASWHRKIVQHQSELDRGKVDICFVGDSITEFWGHTGKPVWELEFHGSRCVNLGVSADRAEDILFRVQRADFSKARPDFFVVMAGTNNLGKEPPDDSALVANRVLEVVRCLQESCPESRILLLSILPSGNKPGSALRNRILKTNSFLDEGVAKRFPSKCQFLDVHDSFVKAGGGWVPRYTIDGTHLTLDGYDRLAGAIVPILRALSVRTSK
ncbi:MAG: hypothetical protein KDN22_32625 [Verrucomicrobiae bacterium]|nr:hypothetical protein [Verrucomicrobiae bacterium]